MKARCEFVRSGDPRHRLALALDLPNRDGALRLVESLGDDLAVVKVGLQLFIACGPSIVRELRERGLEVFLDLKLHDIPNTMAGAVGSLTSLDVALTTLHSTAGPSAIEATAAAAKDTGPALLAVTVLTSLSDEELGRVLGRAAEAAVEVVRRAELALAAGADGLVASPREVRTLRETLGEEPLLVIPGIRPAGAATGDQSRVATPSSALRDGADLLVVGRPIRDAAEPRRALRAILDEMRAAS